MTPQDQEKLFKAVKERFHCWGAKQVSGYVHGVVDGLKCNEPQQDYVRDFKKKRKTYAHGYIYGFVDAYGSDALTADWSRELPELSMEALEYRWWLK